MKKLLLLILLVSCVKKEKMIVYTPNYDKPRVADIKKDDWHSDTTIGMNKRRVYKYWQTK